MFCIQSFFTVNVILYFLVACTYDVKIISMNSPMFLIPVFYDRFSYDMLVARLIGNFARLMCVDSSPKVAKYSNERQEITLSNA